MPTDVYVVVWLCGNAGMDDVMPAPMSLDDAGLEEAEAAAADAGMADVGGGAAAAAAAAASAGAMMMGVSSSSSSSSMPPLSTVPVVFGDDADEFSYLDQKMLSHWYTQHTRH